MQPNLRTVGTWCVVLLLPAMLMAAPAPQGTRSASAGSQSATGPLACADSVNDQAVAGCLQASSTATSGQLFPYPGLNNTFTGPAVVAGGSSNVASGTTSFIGGGDRNTATGDYATVGGGGTTNPDNLVKGNQASGRFSAVVGGGGYFQGNRAAGDYTFIGGGSEHYAVGGWSAIGGGFANRAFGAHSWIGGGRNNYASEFMATIGGGRINYATASDSTVGGGRSNSATGSESTVGGGSYNTASGAAAAIGGGAANEASLNFAAIGGGSSNTASAHYSTVVGGRFNTSSGLYSAIGGGISNSAAGEGGTVPGGLDNAAQGIHSFAAGRSAKANHDGAFVWGDSGVATKASSIADQFNVYASGGTRIFSNSAATTGVLLAAGGGSWTSVSDRNAKENITPVDPQNVLDRLAEIPVSTWNYKAQGDEIRHMGPMAQDFYAAFGLGLGDKSIDTIDPDGIALAARPIQKEEREPSPSDPRPASA